MTPRALVIASVLALAPATPLVAGISSSGTGELVGVERNPWFIGTKPVRYCLDVSPDFSLPRADAAATLRTVLDDWTKTVKALSPRSVSSSDFHDGEASKTITLAFTETACGDAELVLKLGTVDAEVKDRLAHLSDGVLAFAQMTSYDRATGRGAGYVWLAPDGGPDAYKGPHTSHFWSASGVFATVVGHELGHVFGFGHPTTMRKLERGSIMDAALPAEIAQGAAAPVRPTTLIMQNWASWMAATPTEDFRERQFCGKTGSFPVDNGHAASVFGVQPAKTIACIVRDFSPSGPKPFRLVFLDSAGLSVKSVWRIGIDDVDYRYETVAGVYDTRNDFPVPRPFFLWNLYLASFKGTATRTRGGPPVTVPLVIDQHNMTVQLSTIGEDGRFAHLDVFEPRALDVDASAPELGEP